ncbi:MAG: hypothetical protein PHC53_05950, partial [Patescibacteria group bacterium]|nr:hypothetical protein [Patescibacteria group bacterium]
GGYVIYLSEDRRREKSVTVDFEVWDQNEDSGEMDFDLETRNSPNSSQNWKQKFTLKASPQAREKLKVMRDEKKRKEDAEENERKMQFEKYFPGALSFMRSHGKGVVKSEELGTLEPMLKNYFKWDLGPEDTIYIGLEEEHRQWVIKLIHPDGNVYDVVAVSDKI